MRWLYPAAETPGTDVDLDAAYWVDDPGRQCVTAIMVSSADGAAHLDGRSGGLGNPADAALSHCRGRMPTCCWWGRAPFGRRATAATTSRRNCGRCGPDAA